MATAPVLHRLARPKQYRTLGLHINNRDLRAASGICICIDEQNWNLGSGKRRAWYRGPAGTKSTEAEALSLKTCSIAYKHLV